MKTEIQPIPGHKKYGWDGKKVTNIKSGKEMSYNGKYQLVSDKGKNSNLKKEQVEALFVKAPKSTKAVKVAKATKAPVATKKSKAVDGEKKVTKSKQIIALHEAGNSIDKIVEKTGFSKHTIGVTIDVFEIRRLQRKGKTAEEISKALVMKIERVKRNMKP